jgi:glycolate oxidase
LDILNDSISKYGLEFPIKPGSHAACTVGGMISTNAAGLLSKKFKKIEDWIEEITIIDGTGKIFTFSGNEARKFAGTEGCCGIIVEAKLRLSEIREFSSDMFEFESLSEMMQKMNDLQNDQGVAALEYINPTASKLLGMPEKERLLVRYSDGRGKITHDESDRIWKMRENMYSVLMNAGYQKIEDPFFEKGIERFLDWVNKQGAPCYGHIGYGIVHPHFRTDEEVERMVEVVKELEGQVAGEHGVGLLKKKYAPLMITTKIRELKAKYDPNNVMNRFKVI